MPQDNLSHVHHYVPEWYQRLFLAPGEERLHVLNLRPDSVQLANGKSFTHNAYRRVPPSRCFFSDDLYMLRFGQEVTDSLERRFFGVVDQRGAISIPTFSGITGFDDAFASSQGDIPSYMGAQRFRTPRGLDWLKSVTNDHSHNRTLALMYHSFQQHVTMWAECIWELVRATNSTTKFLISDSPVTFYNSRMPPVLHPYPGTEELANVGTRTIFPLGPDVCLVMTHLQYTRNPEQNPIARRINARNYDQVMMYAGNVQYGRELEEEEVARINLILKMKATRYIAAGHRDWLYPETVVKRVGWAVLDYDWFLLPNLWKVGFHTETLVGLQGGGSWASDEYGRHPGHSRYSDRDAARREREHVTVVRAKNKWAKLRNGRSLSETFDDRKGAVADRMMAEYLDSLRKKK